MLYTMVMPTFDLLDALEELRIRLNKSGTERTHGLKAEMGDDCRYYQKSKEIFMNKDYDDVKILVLKILNEYRIVEKDFPNG